MANCRTNQRARIFAACGLLVVLAGAASLLWLLLGTGGESGEQQLSESSDALSSNEFLAAPASSTAQHIEAPSSTRSEALDLRDALPANAVRLRVVDADGKGIEGIPVGLIDLTEVPLPFADLARTWPPLGNDDAPEPPSSESGRMWIAQNGAVRRVTFESISFTSSVTIQSDNEVEAGEETGSIAVPDVGPPAPLPSPDLSDAPQVETGVMLSEVMAHTFLDTGSSDASGWIPRAERPTLYFADAFHWRGVTDARGEAVAAWDRTKAPLVEAAFAFPSRTRSLYLLRAEDPPPSESITLVLPPIERVRVAGVHDLAICREAAWRARLAMAAEFNDGSPAWIAWDALAPLAVVAERAGPLVWERDLTVRIEAFVDAPFAPFVYVDPDRREAGTEALVLRTSEHYAGARGELRDLAGGALPHILADLRQTSWPEQGTKVVEQGSLQLDLRAEIELLLASSATALRARELRVRGTLFPLGSPFLAPSKDASPAMPAIDGVHERDARLDEIETFVDLSTLDAPGVVRDLGILRLGAGPQLLAGHVRWSDGAPLENARVILPRGLASDFDEDDVREALRTDAQGAFRRPGIARLPSFEVEVLTGSFGPRPRFTVEGGRTDLVLEVPRRGGLAGAVVLERPSGVEVHARASDGSVQVAKCNAQGAFVVQGIPLGSVEVSFRSGGAVLWCAPELALTAAEVQRPSALAQIDLRPHAHAITLVLRNATGELLTRATVSVRDPDGAFLHAAPSSRLGELRLIVPKSVRRLVVAVPGHRDQELVPAPGRLELSFVEER